MNYGLYFNCGSFIAVLLCLCHSVLETSGSKILFYHLGATASHRTSIWPLATKLADSGHNITYIFPITNRPGSHPKIEEITPSKVIKAMDHFIGNFDINFRLNNTVEKWLQDGFAKVPSFCEAFYDSPEIQEWLARPGLSYDLFMLDGGFGHCAYPLVHKFQAKHIFFNPVTVPYFWDSSGVVPETSSIPEMILHEKPENLQTSLWSRTKNTLVMAGWKYAYLDAIWKVEAVARNKMNMTDMPSFESMDEKTSLIFQNSYFIEDYPMSLPPLYVSYSGLLCTEESVQARKPLPQNLETFIGDSDGFVYVSFGSAVVASGMPEALRNHFMSAFAAFPNHKFLWRWTGPVPKDTPKNVFLQTWYPQQDVLAHPKIKAFVTQAGRPSAQEALCYGVPSITIPIFGDQDFSSDRLVSIGVATSLDINTLTADKLVSALKAVIYENSYKSRAQQMSKMFWDRPMDPVENAKYWVEFVLRHDTNLLKPLGMKQTWYQRRLLDVYAVILLFVLIFTSVTGIIVYKVSKIILRTLVSIVFSDLRKKRD